MATQYPALTDRHTAFIAKHEMYFVATAARDGRVNVSPKGLALFPPLRGSRNAFVLDIDLVQTSCGDGSRSTGSPASGT